MCDIRVGEYVCIHVYVGCGGHGCYIACVYVCVWYVCGNVVHMTGILSACARCMRVELDVCSMCVCGHTNKTRVCHGLCAFVC